MTIEIPRSLVEYFLLGPTRDRRQLQDSPILGDVWIAFALHPGEPQELLITPERQQTAATVAGDLDDLIEEDRQRNPKQYSPNIAYLHGLIAARLYFDELLRVIVPLTTWWKRNGSARRCVSTSTAMRVTRRSRLSSSPS